LRMPVCLIMVAEILNSGFVHECSDFTNWYVRGGIYWNNN
jgi:hypothetical protein